MGQLTDAISNHALGVRPQALRAVYQHIQSSLYFYHLKPWEQKTGARPLLYLPLAYAVAGQRQWMLLLFNTLAAVGVFAFAGAFDDYWDYRIRGERNFLSAQIRTGHATDAWALFFACVPLLLTLPLLACAPSLGLPSSIVTLPLLAAVGLLIGYSMPPLRLKDRAPWGFFVGPLLGPSLFLVSCQLLTRPMNRSTAQLAVLLFLFQCYAESIHVVDNARYGRPMYSLSFATAFRLARGLPFLALIVSGCFALSQPVYLVAAGAWGLRWWTVGHLDPPEISRLRRNLWSPMWSLYEFIAYAWFGLSGTFQR